MSFLPLPIDSYIPQILSELEKNSRLIIRSTPGSGKTTRVPPALLNLSVIKKNRKKILVLLPRRITAKMAALRGAFENNQTVGEEIGYHFRLEKSFGPNTALIFITEGMLLRYMLTDPTLRDVGVVILDEFHERHLHTDVALALLTKLQKTERPDLKVVIMSATLNVNELQRYWPNASLIDIQTPIYPLQIKYHPAVAGTPLEALIDSAIKSQKTNGNILVFLSGKKEISRAYDYLSTRHPQYQVAPLHGELDIDTQQKVIQKGGRQKIILSTNIAESSLTIEGVDCVIDSGLHRRPRQSHLFGGLVLESRPISRASADQRAGRAARTGPGVCIRLYTEHDYKHRAEFETSEITRLDLSETFLTLFSLGIKNLQELHWLESPSDERVRDTLELLKNLGAITIPPLPNPLPQGERGYNDNWKITNIGQQMSQLALPVRLSRAVVAAKKENSVVYNAVLRLAVLLQMRGTIPFNFEEWFYETLKNPLEKQWGRQLGMSEPSESLSKVDCQKITQSLLEGFFDAVGMVKGESDVLLCRGKMARLPRGVQVSHKLGLMMEGAEVKKGGAKDGFFEVKSWCELTEEMLLNPSLPYLSEESSYRYHETRDRVEQTKSLKYGVLVLEESTIAAPPSKEAAEILLKGAFGLSFDKKEWTVHRVIEALLSKGVEVEAEFAKLALFLKYRGDGNATLPSGVFLADTIETVLSGVVTVADVKNLSWHEAMLPFIPKPLHKEWRVSFVDHVTIKNKRTIPVHYQLGQDPWVESRLQDFIGVKNLPSLFGGKVKIVAKLLAPNKRPVQITSDLEGFWKKAYQEIRPQLMRRYPRHEWPV